jgi:hypothetical protein
LNSPLWPPWFVRPVGWAVSIGFHPVASLLGVLHVAALAAVAWRDRGSRWATACGLAAAADVVALMSIVRIPGEVQDHAVFWVGVLGTIGVGLLLGIAAMRLIPSIADAIARRETLVRIATTGVLAAVALLLTAAGVAPLERDPGDHPQPIGDLAAATAEGLERRHAGAPFVRIGDDAWSEAAGTLLQLYKRGVPFGVERQSVHMFGSPLAADGCRHSHVLSFVAAGSPAGGEVIARTGTGEVRLEPSPGCVAGEP